MESHPLNMAHQQHRRAEAHLRYKRFDEAMQCHHNAAELLIDAMKSTTSSVALESITLQHSYHLKQKDLIKSKKDQYERIKHAMDNVRHISKDPHTDIENHENSKVQIAIYKNIDKSSTLLNTLLTKNITSEVIKKTDEIDEKCNEKNQQSVIGDLQQLGENLHSLVEQLMMQVEVVKDENATIKEQVDYLEKERIKYLNLQSYDLQMHNKFPIFNDSQNNIQDMTQHTADPPKPYKIRAQHPFFDLSAFKDDE